MKAHIEPTDWGRRSYKIVFYSEAPGGEYLIFTFTGPGGWETHRVDPGAEIDVPPLELPREAVEALVEATLRERLSVGELDTLVIEELRQQRARVDKLIDHILSTR